ncbi:MAG TPA: ATP-binding protein [Verrucomicrobiae bacterium]|jgi:signal transduction histidine kinase|nr:ATP-binding protein [Verrucomicrobiae bacterium]
MMLSDVPIKRKLTTVMMLTSTVALVLTAGAFTAYEVVSFRKNLLQNAQTIAQITAAQTSASVAFDDEKTAQDILSKLRAEPTIMRAAVYDKSGVLLASHPASVAASEFPRPQPAQYSFGASALRMFTPIEVENQPMGTLYMEWDLNPAYGRFRLYAAMGLCVLIGSSVIALLLSQWLQDRISRPILELADTARAVSEQKDYLVRAKKLGKDELGSLTDAFNHMLTQIHQRDAALRENQEKLERALNEAEKSSDAVRALNSELEQRVENRTAELRSANHELEAFTYSVSHDLRSPLRHIDAYAQILEEEQKTQISTEAKRCIDRIRQGVQNMGHLVDDLLNLSRVGRAELQKEMTPLNPLVDEVIAELKPETKDRVINWRVAALPAMNCDPGLVKQVFANLISNAVKYTRPRPAAMIEVGTVAVEGMPAIFVRDNGVGFNMKYSNKLFGVFQRLHRPDEFEGTGVGLATVQRIVTLHGGRIWAEAELDKGAAFYFTLGQPIAAEKTA